MVRNGLPFVPHLSQLRHEVDRLFDDYFAPAAARAGVRVGAFPAVNLWEKQNELIAEAELPGVKSEDLEVTVVGDELTIKGRRATSHDESATYHRRERGVGDFVRVVHLPVEIDADRVEAALADGVLRVTLPKAAAATPRKIEIRSNEPPTT
jgi:HSP20 family protein